MLAIVLVPAAAMAALLQFAFIIDDQTRAAARDPDAIEARADGLFARGRVRDAEWCLRRGAGLLEIAAKQADDPDEQARLTRIAERWRRRLR